MTKQFSSEQKEIELMTKDKMKAPDGTTAESTQPSSSRTDPLQHESVQDQHDHQAQGASSILERFIRILGLGSAAQVSEAFHKFDREALIRIHDQGLRHLTDIRLARYFGLQDGPAQEESVPMENPLIEPADELIPAKLSYLPVDKPNECMVVYGELCVEPFKFGRIFTVMEELHTGNGVCLSIAAQDPLCIDQSAARKAYPKGMRVAVKEPTLVRTKQAGCLCLYIQNPFSIESLPTFPDLINSKTLDKKTVQWLCEGNLAFKAEKWEDCARNYSKCLQASVIVGKSKRPMKSTNMFQLYFQRARAYIGLKRCESALSDAENALEIVPGNMAVLMLKTEALVALARYQEAEHHVQNSCQLLEDGDACKQKLIRHYRQMRVEFFAVGKALASGTGRGHISAVTGEDFIGPVEIRMSDKGRGRGLFATEAIEAGDVVLICRALALSDSVSPFVEEPVTNGLLRNVLKALYDSTDKRLLLQFLALQKRGEVPKMELFTTELSDAEYGEMLLNHGIIEIDWERVLDSIHDNAFDDMSVLRMENPARLVDSIQSRFYQGMWLLPSFINHSCIPNASRVHADGLMSIHATTGIAMGEEITIPYFDVLFPFNARMATCEEYWRFACVCNRCLVEKIANELFHPMSVRTRIEYRNVMIDIQCGNRRINFEKLGRISNAVDAMIEEFKIKALFGSIEANWVASSYIVAKLAWFMHQELQFPSENVSDKAVHEYCSNSDLAIEAMAKTCPGNVRYLHICANHLESFRFLGNQHPDKKIFKDYVKKIEDNIKNVCICVYGNYSTHIIEAIIRRFSFKPLL